MPESALQRLPENEVFPLSDSDRWFFRMAQYIEGDDRNQSMLLPAAIDDDVSPARPVHLETMDRARERLTAVPDAMRQRAALLEHPFGTIKDRHGYGGLLCRGLSLAGAEMGLSAWADNFTRVINLVGTQGLLGAIRVRRMAAQGY